MYEKFGGKQVKNVAEYARKYIAEHPNTDIYIGTDSDVVGSRYVRYSTAICFRKRHINGDGNGVHVIFERVTESGKVDLFTRLWSETLKSEVAAREVKPITDELGVDLTIDCDISPMEDCGSSIAYNASIGYLKGMGYAVRAKPESWAASSAADLLCR